MKKNALVEFSVAHPKRVLAAVLLVTPLFLAQLPKIQLDTNPKNMLPPTSDVRVWNDSVDQTFGLYEDTIVVGQHGDFSTGAGMLGPGVHHVNIIHRHANHGINALGLDGIYIGDIARQMISAAGWGEGSRQSKKHDLAAGENHIG